MDELPVALTEVSSGPASAPLPVANAELVHANVNAFEGGYNFRVAATDPTSAAVAYAAAGATDAAGFVRREGL